MTSRKLFQCKQRHSGTCRMSDEMNRLAWKVATGVRDDVRNDPGLSPIVPLHCQLHWVPWTEASPVNDPDGVRKLTSNQPSSDTVIDRTAALDSRQDDDESVLKSSCDRQWKMKSRGRLAERCKSQAEQ